MGEQQANKTAFLSEPYYASLGLFVHSFAMVEGALQELVWKVLGVSKSTAKAALSTVRVDSAIDTLKRYQQLEGAAFPDHLLRALDQLRAVSTARNHIVHSGARYDKASKWMISNEWIAMPGKAKVYPAEPGFLSTLTDDLRIINSAIHAHYFSFGDDVDLHWSNIHERSAVKPFKFVPPQPPR